MGLHQTLDWLVPQPWTSPPPRLRNKLVLFKPPSLWYSVMTALVDKDRMFIPTMAMVLYRQFQSDQQPYEAGTEYTCPTGDKN